MNLNNVQNLLDLSNYFQASRVTDSLAALIFDALLLLVMTTILGLVYVKSAYSLSNRKRLALLFPTLALTTMMIISVIQSSLALSLGLVGALSIVRFRAAIKEPEELIYIFLTVSLGLGFGAGQREVAVVFFIIIVTLMIAKLIAGQKISFINPKKDQIMYVDIKQEIEGDQKDDLLIAITQILNKHCKMVDLKRLDVAENQHNLMFEVKIADVKALSKMKNEILNLPNKPQLSILQHEDLFS